MGKHHQSIEIDTLAEQCKSLYDGRQCRGFATGWPSPKLLAAPKCKSLQPSQHRLALGAQNCVKVLSLDVNKRANQICSLVCRLLEFGGAK